MFRNLIAEMARNNISNNDIAECLQVGEKTVRNYLSGRSKIPWEKALKIKRDLFPELDMEYLFAVNKPA